MERLKDEFVSTVNHELRTPLTSIAGSLGLLVGGAASALPKSALRLIGIAAPLQPTWKRVQDAINHGWCQAVLTSSVKPAVSPRCAASEISI
jgi:signal transduction histidine kinase